MYQCLEKKSSTSYEILNIIQGLIFTSGLAAACLLSAYNVVNGRASASELPTLISYWFQLQQPLNNLGYSYKNIHKAFIDAETILKLLMEELRIKDKEGAVDLVVENDEIDFNHVEFSYDGQSKASTLADLTFCALPGQTVALVGTSGSGKSTVHRLLYRYYDIESGIISIDGQNIRDLKLESLRSSIGIVPQVKFLQHI